MASTPTTAATGAGSKPTPTPRQRADPSPHNAGQTDQRGGQESSDHPPPNPSHSTDHPPQQQQQKPHPQQRDTPAKIRTLRLRDHVGFDSLPDQIVSKAISQGFSFPEAIGKGHG